MGTVPLRLSAVLYSNFSYSFRLSFYNPLADIYSNYCIPECILKRARKEAVSGEAAGNGMYARYRSNTAPLCKCAVGC